MSQQTPIETIYQMAKDFNYKFTEEDALAIRNNFDIGLDMGFDFGTAFHWAVGEYYKPLWEELRKGN